MNASDQMVVNGDVTSDLLDATQRAIENIRIKPGKIIDSASFTAGIESIAPLASALAAVLSFLFSVYQYKIGKKSARANAGTIRNIVSVGGTIDFEICALNNLDDFSDGNQIDRCSVHLLDKAKSRTYAITIDKTGVVNITILP